MKNFFKKLFYIIPFHFHIFLENINILENIRYNCYVVNHNNSCIDNIINIASKTPKISLGNSELDDMGHRSNDTYRQNYRCIRRRTVLRTNNRWISRK